MCISYTSTIEIEASRLILNFEFRAIERYGSVLVSGEKIFKSCVGDSHSYVGDNKSYVGDSKSYVGVSNSYVGDSNSYVGDKLSPT